MNNDLRPLMITMGVILTGILLVVSGLFIWAVTRQHRQ